jgi:catechol 2,3-dioxygenase-like lactoylglutathione lyase family enzyme
VSWTAIRSFQLVTPDPARLVRFYAALGFTPGEAEAIPAEEMRVLGLAGGGWRQPLRLGGSLIELDRFDAPGRPYPSDATAADLVFQHLALVTDDAAAAWARAQAAGAVPISRDGPVTLPASSGGVTAVKFRDPDGHPLELLRFPPGANADWTGRGVMGIDHSAIAVADAAASRRFYAGHDLTEGKPTLNEEPGQVALDGLDGAVADVVPLRPATKPPHLELLCYRHPRGRSHAPLEANDVAGTRIVWAADRDVLVRDPDGHLHQLTR